MNKEIKILIDALNLYDCEFEILDDVGCSIYQSSNYLNIKNDSNDLERNIVRYVNNYYEFSRKEITIDDKTYHINKYNDITRFQNDILMLKEDVLTTLPNRYAIELFLDNNIDSNIITVICDLDDFKQINDNFGHPQGDVVLREFGIILKRLLSQNIFVGRYGGEEFLMFFKDTNFKFVKEQLEEIRKQISINSDLTNDKYKIKMSAGMSMLNSDKTLKTSIKEADMALYFVKNNGKNADAIYDDETKYCYIIE